MDTIKIIRVNLPLIVSAILVLGASNVLSQTQTPASQSADEQTIRRLEDEWLSCYVTGDRSKYDRIVADDYTGIDESAVLRTKTEDRALLPSSPSPGGTALNEDLQVRVRKEFAIVTGRIVTKVRIEDKEMIGFRTRFTDTWTKRLGEWKVVARHYSRFPIERVPAKVDTRVFAEYTGRYELGPGVEFTILKEAASLYYLVPGQTKLELIPESDLVFFAKDIPTAIFLFVRDEKGQVARLLTIQDGKVTTLNRVK